MNELYTIPELLKIDLPKSHESFEIPKLSSKISCGLFGISDDFIEKYQSLDAKFIKNKFSTFFFEAVGDSMEPTIFEGQILIVDRSLKDFHQKVCVISYEDKLICKRVYLKSTGIILHSDNPKYKDIIISESEGLNLWGVVIAIAGHVK